LKQQHVVLGVDPGFASCGYAEVLLEKDTETVLRMGVIRTQRSGKKRRVLETEDMVRRGRELSSVLGMLVQDSAVVAAESLSYPPSASSSAKLAMCWGVIVAHSQLAKVPILQASPQAIKKHVCDAGNATKDEVRRALQQRFGKHKLELAIDSDLPLGQYEHAYDALAAAVCCLDSDTVRMVRKLAG
jgi:crossover junction endodeoxyribonuclease RuvC